MDVDPFLNVVREMEMGIVDFGLGGLGLRRGRAE
jgi:hypothetical protein